VAPQNCNCLKKFLIILSVRSQFFLNFANLMLSIFSKQTVLTKEASGNSRQDRLGVNGFLMGF
jgi:hypothetical protein